MTNFIFDLQRFTGGTWSGSGTADDSYQIADAADLQELVKDANGRGTYINKCFKLTADIDLSTLQGEDDSQITLKPIQYFKGTFDGDGHIISNLKIGNWQDAGLFGRLEGTVKNLRTRVHKRLSRV